jgi:glutathione synthase/RimK-type ligase-like ATP-grasp enzyme
MKFPNKPIGILYENHVWFKPLFAELQRRNIPYVRINAAQSQFNPQERDVPYSLIVNRVSASAYLRGNVQGIFYTASYLNHIERLGIPVINGTFAQEIENSKVRQVGLIASLGLAYPKTRVINHISQLLSAAKSLRFPILIKPNMGASSTGILRFDTVHKLQRAIDLHQINLGVDHSTLVQEFIPPKGGHIVRVETLNGNFLYALKIFPAGSNFNLYPAEFHHIRNASDDTSSRQVRVESFTPSHKIIDDAQRIAKGARLDAGGIEYLIHPETDEPYYYDINVLSNFLVNAEDVIGFNPYEAFVDYLEQRLKPIYEIEQAPAL